VAAASRAIVLGCARADPPHPTQPALRGEAEVNRRLASVVFGLALALAAYSAYVARRGAAAVMATR
jgi:hypothetical protein